MLVVISITMLNILDVEELDGIWHPKFLLQMEWFDSRIQMQNLNDDMQLNVLVSEERNDPWIPVVFFNNHDKRKRLILDDNTSLVVRKEGNGTFNEGDYETLVRAQVFNGEENPFVFERSYSTDLECDFDLRNFPFDTQECFIELRVPLALTNKVELKAKKIGFENRIDLTQFHVQSSSVSTVDGKAYFIVVFKRKFAYHLISVYIPSFSLLGISLVTLHISIDHFEANIMVHLTAMLVMYTLFQAISISLPQV